MARANGAAVSSSPGKSGFKACRPLSRLAGTTPVRLSSVLVSRINLQLGLAQSGGDVRSAKKSGLWILRKAREMKKS